MLCHLTGESGLCPKAIQGHDSLTGTAAGRVKPIEVLLCKVLSLTFLGWSWLLEGMCPLGPRGMATIPVSGLSHRRERKNVESRPLSSKTWAPVLLGRGLVHGGPGISRSKFILFIEFLFRFTPPYRFPKVVYKDPRHNTSIKHQQYNIKQYSSHKIE